MANPTAEDRFGFSHIADAMKLINRRVNLAGVVTQIGIPKHSNGTDRVCTLRIVDESSPTSGISVNFFGENFEKLPCVEEAGDIIQIMNVTIRSYGSGDDTHINAVFDKRFSAFGLYKGRNASDYVANRVSSKFFPTMISNYIIERLRKWIISIPPKKDLCASSYWSYIREIEPEKIKEGQEFNLICKVLHICEVQQGEWMLFVWDGTNALSLSVNTKIGENPIPLQIEPSCLSRNVLCKFPTVGTVLRIASDHQEKLGLHSLKVVVGKWVLFKDITFKVQYGLCCGMLLLNSKFSYLSNEDDRVLQHLKKYKKRAKRRCEQVPFSCIPLPSQITYTDHENEHFSTLMDVLCHPEVIGNFRCVVRVLAILPGHPRRFRSSSGTYRLRLTLEDPTARIHANLYANEGEKFFGGHPGIDIMIKMFNILLGNEENDDEKPRNPPWVELCLNSYYTDNNDIWGSRNYRIIDTKFKLTV